MMQKTQSPFPYAGGLQSVHVNGHSAQTTIFCGYGNGLLVPKLIR
jgi:hypothetical protein